MLDYVVVVDFLRDWFLSEANTVWYGNRMLQNEFNAKTDAIKISGKMVEIGITLHKAKFERITTCSIETYNGDIDSEEIASKNNGTQSGIGNTITFHTTSPPNYNATTYPEWIEGNNRTPYESYDAYLPLAGALPGEIGIKPTDGTYISLRQGYTAKRGNKWVQTVVVL